MQIGPVWYKKKEKKEKKHFEIMAWFPYLESVVFMAKILGDLLGNS